MRATSPRHLLHVFSTFAVGGPQVRFAKLANRLGQRYRHTILAMDGDFACRERLHADLHLAFLPVAVEKTSGVSFANLRHFRRILVERQPNLLLTYNWGAVEWALANRLRPVCRHLHFEDGLGPDEADGRQFVRRIWMRRVALSGPTQVVVPSHLLFRIATEVWRLSPERVLHIPNGIDCDRFAAPPDPAALAALQIRSGELVIGTVGALRAEKNFGRLLRAFAALPAGLPDIPPARLVVVGDGPERPALEALAARLGIAGRVVFAGHVARPETVLGRFDIFAMSSDTEQMPLGLIEAMAAGLPVVATDVGDIRTMVAAENQPLILPRADEPAFAAGLAALLRDPERRRQLGESNRRRVRRDFDETAMIDAYDELLWTLSTAPFGRAERDPDVRPPGGAPPLG